jgi:carbamoyl-phosphate synthase large subunit
LKWPGPFEIELIREEGTGEYVLVEINPRFPAWIDFPSMLGVNFAALLVDMLQLDHVPASLPDCKAGSFYIRHQVEVVGDINRYAGLLKGESDALADLIDETPVRSTKTKVLS